MTFASVLGIVTALESICQDIHVTVKVDQKVGRKSVFVFFMKASNGEE